MRSRILLLGLLGCWSSSPKQASPPPAPVDNTAKAKTGGDTYGGLAYGGMDYAGELPASPYGGKGGGGGGGGTGGGAGTGGGSAVASSGPMVGDPNALDPAIIRRYIRRNIAKIQYCYEKELLANASAQGKVTVRFTITSNGNVTQASGSGMPPVDACVASVISGIAFPKPKGGGSVAVSYPFIFQSPP